jgi:ribosome-associated translation inhibitor RaiA
MHLEIRRQNIRLDEGQLDEIERRLTFALDQFESWVTDVTIHLEDVNGSKGGVDKECRILVNLRSGKTLKIEDIDADIVAAVARASDRLSHTVSREVQRVREH